MKHRQTKAEREEAQLYGDSLYHLNRGLTRRLEEAYFAEIEADEDWQEIKQLDHDLALAEAFINKSQK